MDVTRKRRLDWTEVVMEVRNIAQGRAMSSLRAARITNIRQRPLLVTTLMLLSIACVYLCAVNVQGKVQSASW